MQRRPLLQALAGLALPSLALAASPDRQADLARLQAHLRFLADPLLEGREAGTRGFDLAAAYVASQFAQLGLKPLGEAGSYLQPVRLKTGRLAATAPVLELCRGDRCEPLAYLDEFSTRADLMAAHSDVSAPLVFAGYGITAPSFGLDDYAGLDVRGKIVVTLWGRPPALPPEEGAHFGSARTKAELAVKLGAIGLIQLATMRSEIVAPFHLARQYADSISMDWLAPNGSGGNEIAGQRVSATVSVQAAPKLLAALNTDYARLVADAEAGRSLPRGDLGLSARLVRDTVHGQALSHNIVGLLQGRHPQLKREVVVLSAHLDHLGRKPGPNGDIVYPGAMDNALGIATLLETARLLAQGPAPQRSIVFVALTGEEKGLIGSSWFASHPPVPADTLVAAINIDMPILLHDFSEVVALGGPHSTLGAAAQRAAARLGLKTAPDPEPAQSRFTRSDQYSFVRRGIPAVILGAGSASFDARDDGATLMREFRRLRYHQPGDDLSQPFRWSAVQRFAQLHHELLLDITRQPERPQWLPGDFFGELFAAHPGQPAS
ncbi:MAG TPA: M28 family metallopeptidase [Roseateles sp.]